MLKIATAKPKDLGGVILSTVSILYEGITEQHDLSSGYH